MFNKISKLIHRRSSSASTPSASEEQHQTLTGDTQARLTSPSSSSSRTRSTRTSRRSRARRLTRRRKPCGAPPASVAALSSLVHLRLRGICPDNQECVICAEDFKINDVVTTLPCGHMHHSECVLKWLARHCTCPACRFEMPTDNAKFERAKARKANATSATEHDYPVATTTADNALNAEAGQLTSLLSIGTKENGVKFLDKPANFDLILMRSLRVQEEIRQARREADGSAYSVSDDGDGDLDTDEDSLSSTSEDKVRSSSELVAMQFASKAA